MVARLVPVIMCPRRLSRRAPLFLLVSSLLLARLFFSHALEAPDLLLKVGWHEKIKLAVFSPIDLAFFLTSTSASTSTLTETSVTFFSPQTKLSQGGTVVNGDASFRADVLVIAGKIAEVGLDIEPPPFPSPPSSSRSWLPKFFSSGNGRDGKPRNLKTIDCSGLLVLPGAVDPHTHLDAQMMGTTTADDFYTGTRAALAGGTTTVIDFALPRPGDGDLLAGLERYEEVSKVAACDYGFHMAVTNWSSRIEEQVGELARNR